MTIKELCTLIRDLPDTMEVWTSEVYKPVYPKLSICKMKPETQWCTDDFDYNTYTITAYVNAGFFGPKVLHVQKGDIPITVGELKEFICNMDGDACIVKPSDNYETGHANVDAEAVLRDAKDGKRLCFRE